MKAKLLRQELLLAYARLEAAKEDIQRLKSVLQAPAPMRSPHPLHMTEEEEDVEFLAGTGLIDITEAQKLLREMAFENAEVHFADDSVLDEVTLD